jgi:hypothetical protein
VIVFGEALDCRSEGNHVLTCDTINIASKLYKSVRLIHFRPDSQAVRRQVYYARRITYGSNLLIRGSPGIGS